MAPPRCTSVCSSRSSGPSAAEILDRELGTVKLEPDPAGLSVACDEADRGAEAVAELARRDVAVAGFSLGQPSLDEVFLALTGRPVEDETKRRGGRGGMSDTRTGDTTLDGVEEQAIRKALSSAPRPARPSPVSAVLTFGWRGILKIKHVPEQLIDATMTPVLFTLMFTYMYGGAISGSTSEYLTFILPGILMMSVVFTTVYSGVALNTDLTKGVVDRFRSLPIWRPAPLVGSVVGDSVRYLVAGTVVIIVGAVLGYRPDGGWEGVLAALALTIIFSFALAWVFTTLGLIMRSPNAVMNTGFMALFPLTFLSNAFVPPETLPSGLEAFVEINPISWVVTANRGLMNGTAEAGDILLVLATAVVLTAVFVPLTSRLYRKK